MAEGKLNPDAPYKSGITGKYKLLIRKVTPKTFGYEYQLVDAEGKEYKAISKLHFEENQLLRCIVSFEVKNAKFALSDIAICNKQDLALQVHEPKVINPKNSPKPLQNPVKSNSLFDIIDDLQKKGRKTGPMSDEEIQNILKQIDQKKTARKGTYRCCGKTHSSLYLFRKHLFECHPLEYDSFFVTALHRTVPSPVRGVGIKRSKGPSKNKDNSPTQYEGDRFRLIYTPMGNKR